MYYVVLEGNLFKQELGLPVRRRGPEQQPLLGLLQRLGAGLRGRDRQPPEVHPGQQREHGVLPGRPLRGLHGALPMGI